MRRLAKQARGGFTRYELVAVIVLLLLIVSVVLVRLVLHDVRRKEYLWECQRWNQEIGAANRIWEDGHHGLLPAQTSVTNGGWKELLGSGAAGQFCWTNFALLRNELPAGPRVLACPEDERRPIAHFTANNGANSATNDTLQANTNLSYFVAVNAPATPNAIVGGDRNLGAGAVPDSRYGWSPDNGKGNDIVLASNSIASWSLKMHSDGDSRGRGVLLLRDGSVQTPTSSELVRWRQAALPANPGPTTNFSQIRLVFP